LECWRVANSCSRPIYERRMGQEIDGEVLGEVYKGYVFKLSGGNDKDGFPMKQGIMINGRTRMMFKNGRMFSLLSLNKNNNFDCFV
jgi:ribosomal protein S6E (S10)